LRKSRIIRGGLARIVRVFNKKALLKCTTKIFNRDIGGKRQRRAEIINKYYSDDGLGFYLNLGLGWKSRRFIGETSEDKMLKQVQQDG
jgi:hypothetical protein